MSIDDFGITELSRLLNKSRPTVYKYITDYKGRKYDSIPNSVKQVFDLITNGSTKSEIYAYCERSFLQPDGLSEDIKEVFSLIIENQSAIDIEKLKNYILKELKK